VLAKQAELLEAQTDAIACQSALDNFLLDWRQDLVDAAKVFEVKRRNLSLERCQGLAAAEIEDDKICHYAFDQKLMSWSTSKQYVVFVAEGTRRNLDANACAKAKD
jgi:hypothetical protein